VSDATDPRSSNDDASSVDLTKPSSSLRWITQDSAPMDDAFAAAKAANPSAPTYSEMRLAMTRSTRSIVTEPMLVSIRCSRSPRTLRYLLSHARR
jgi:hypothetical protein